MSCAYDPWGESTGVLVVSRQRRSRKAHRCAECRRIIDRGEIYSNERWRFHDALVEYKLCADCRSAARLLASYEMGRMWFDLATSLPWDGGEAASCRLEELTPWARMAVCGLIDGMWREG